MSTSPNRPTTMTEVHARQTRMMTKEAPAYRCHHHSLREVWHYVGPADCSWLTHAREYEF
mgnify:CR=1 FL=1